MSAALRILGFYVVCVIAVGGQPWPLLLVASLLFAPVLDRDVRALVSAIRPIEGWGR